MAAPTAHFCRLLNGGEAVGCTQTGQADRQRIEVRSDSRAQLNFVNGEVKARSVAPKEEEEET